MTPGTAQNLRPVREIRLGPSRLDNEAYGHLGLYYAEKLRGAIALAQFLFSGDAAQQAQAVAHLRKALDEILAGKHVSVSETKAFGCTIKRVE